MKRDFQNDIRHAVKDYEALHTRVLDAVVKRRQSKEDHIAWKDACTAWNGHRSILNTFENDDALNRLEDGDPDLLDLAIAFVEVNPFYFRSGYLKKRLFRRLKHLKLTDTQRRRILMGILSAIRSQQGNGWKDFCSLATAFADSDFISSVSRFAEDADSHVVRRANLLLKYLVK